MLRGRYLWSPARAWRGRAVFSVDDGAGLGKVLYITAGAGFDLANLLLFKKIIFLSLQGLIAVLAHDGIYQHLVVFDGIENAQITNRNPGAMRTTNVLCSRPYHQRIGLVE